MVNKQYISMRFVAKYFTLIIFAVIFCFLLTFFLNLYGRENMKTNSETDNKVYFLSKTGKREEPVLSRQVEKRTVVKIPKMIQKTGGDGMFKKRKRKKTVNGVDKREDVSDLKKYSSILIEVDLRHPDQVPLPKAVYEAQPSGAPGENGTAIKVKKKDLSPDKRKIWETGYNNYGYNSYVSGMISIKRTMPDIRLESCPRVFRRDLPETSIIICFHNEAWSVLLRLVHSVLKTSPDHLIKEIILFDDFSKMDHLGKPLEYYMSKLKKVRIVRAKQRVGSIRARSLAMSIANASVLTVLDSQCECYPGWLEPLLDRVTSDDTVIVAPVINVVHKNTFGAERSQMYHIGGIDLRNLEFKWLELNDARRKNHPAHEAYKTPAIAGGLFSMRKDFFIKTGKYDEEMEIWGPDNVEMSLRTWMCGGSLEKHPCSHVGHVFRDFTPYSWGRSIGQILKKNRVRVAEVWLDDYKKYYYRTIDNKLGDYGNVSARQQLRKDLKCKSFQWYIDNVYPEIPIPSEHGTEEQDDADDDGDDDDDNEL